jgi:hypothetical protein
MSRTSPTQQIVTALLGKNEFASVNLRILNQSGQGCQEPAKKRREEVEADVPLAALHPVGKGLILHAA